MTRSNSSSILSFLLLAISGAAAGAHADTRVDSVVRYYDDGDTQVISPHLEASQSFSRDQYDVSGGYAMDIVNSNSSDVRSFSSKSVQDTRREENLGLAMNLKAGTVSMGFVQSDENDYHSTGGSIGVSHDFFDKNTTVALDFNAGFDTINSSTDPTFDQYSKNQGFSFSITQILSRLSLVQFLYDGRLESGYLASPYRRARLLQPNGSILPVPEVHPQSRMRHSLAMKYNYHLESLGVSTSSSVRLYTDTWGVSSGTLEERLTRQFGNFFGLSLNCRYYQQLNASFYQDEYARLPNGFVTGNKTLASYYTLLIGLRPTLTFSDHFRVYGKGEYYIQRFQNHTDVGNVADPTDDKPLVLNALITGFGLEGVF